MIQLLTVLEAGQVLFPVRRLGLVALEELGTLAVVLLLCKLPRGVPLLPHRWKVQQM